MTGLTCDEQENVAACLAATAIGEFFVDCYSYSTLIMDYGS